MQNLSRDLSAQISTGLALTWQRMQRQRSVSPPMRKILIDTSSGKDYEPLQRPRRESKSAVQSVDRRRSKDVVVETVAATLHSQTAGRPPKGQQGPYKRSLRSASQARGGLVGKNAMHRGAKQLRPTGHVRDQRRSSVARRLTAR